MKTMSMFEEADIEVTEPEPMTTVRVGSRVAQIPFYPLQRISFSASSTISSI